MKALLTTLLAVIATCGTAQERHLLVRARQASDLAAVQLDGQQLQFTAIGQGQGQLFQVVVPEDKAATALFRLRHLPQVLSAEADQQLQPLSFAPKETVAPTALDQYETVNAPAAWALQSGSRDVVIAIVDGGFWASHAELAPDYLYNDADPIDGVDNDGNGYVDDYAGWDTGNGDNDPSPGSTEHGTRVAGVAARAGQNSSLLNVKIYTDGGGLWISDAIEGLYYAAGRGADIIVMPWGSPNLVSPALHQAICDIQATYQVAFVGSAGNTLGNIDFYPASYPEVLSVGQVNSLGGISPNTTYSRYMDLVAPGYGIRTTTGSGSSYVTEYGSSFSAPMVAGAMALVKAQHPELSGLALQAHVEATADLAAYAGLAEESYVGNGLLDMEAALLRPTSAQWVTIGKTETDLPTLMPGVGFWLDLPISVFPAPGSATTVDFALTTSELFLLESTTGQVTVDAAGKGTITIKGGVACTADVDQELSLDLQLTGTWSGQDRTKLLIAGDYFDLPSGELSLQVGPDGTLGYQGDLAPNGALSRSDLSMPILFLMGTAIVTDAGQVYGTYPKDQQLGTPARDYEVVKSTYLSQTGHTGIEARTLLRLPAEDLLLDMRVLALPETDGLDGYLFTYKWTNEGTEARSFDFGMYTDFDINPYLGNSLQAIESESHIGSLTFNGADAVAMSLFTKPTGATVRAVDIGDFNGHTPEVGPTYDSAEVVAHVRNLSPKTTAGQLEGGNNVASWVNRRVASLAPGASTTLQYGLAVGNGQAPTLAATETLATTYFDHLEETHVWREVTACAGEELTLEPFALGQEFSFTFAGALNLLVAGTSASIAVAEGATSLTIGRPVDGYTDEMEHLTIEGLPLPVFEVQDETIVVPEGPMGDYARLVALAQATDYTYDWVINDQEFFDTEQVEVAGLTTGQVVTWQVTATHPNGCQATQLGQWTVVSHQDLASLVRAYPVPSAGMLTLEVPAEGSYTLTDLQGRLVMSGVLRPGAQQLNLRPLSEGLYHLHYVSSLGRHTFAIPVR